MEIDNQKLEEFRRLGRPAALRDIAKVTGCSLAAVSTALNNATSTTGVSADKRQMILQTATLMGYRPNFAARSLLSRQSMTIGVCISRNRRESVLGPFYEAPMLQGMERTARAAGYDLLLLDSHDCVKKFAENRMDALILPTGFYVQDELEAILAASPNIITIDHAPHEKIDAVIFDNFAAVRLAVEHLMSLGHRRIGFVGNLHKDPMADVTTRRDAFRRIVSTAALPLEQMICDSAICREDVIPTGDYCVQEGGMAAGYFLSLNISRRPTAIVCYNDVVAAGLMDALIKTGLSLPDDMSVVGIDNSQICDFLSPALTSVRHPLEEMGELAVSRLVEKLAADKTISTNSVMVLQPELVVRRSTVNPR